MLIRHFYPHWKAIVLVASVLLLASCSASRLAYGNLDWMIRWKIGDYLPLERDQKRWLRTRIDNHLAWHCSSELPRYLPLLDELEASLLDPELDPAMLGAGLPRVEAAVDRLLIEIMPTATELLGQLDDRQVRELERNLQDKQTELEEKYLEPDLDTQHRERIERAQERLEEWLGTLNSAQQARLADWAAQLQGHNRIWLESRQAWQNSFMQVLEQRDLADFEKRLAALLLDREQYWTTDYQRINGVNRAQGKQLVTDLMQLASSEQRLHLEKKIDSFRSDIQALRCDSA